MARFGMNSCVSFCPASENMLYQYQMALKAADKVLKTWFERRWPDKLRCEV